MKKYISEFIGTFILVLFGTGTYVISRNNLIATSLAFGLSITINYYICESISDCHFNPVVSLAMLITKKIKFEKFIWYIVAQTLGAIIGSTILVIVLSNTDLGNVSLGANSYGAISPINITSYGAFVIETILTLLLVYIVLLVNNDQNKGNTKGIIIGITLILIHLICTPLTGTSVNPARSIAPAIFSGKEAIRQLGVFILAPSTGGILAAILYKYLNKNKKTNIKQSKKDVIK